MKNSPWIQVSRFSLAAMFDWNNVMRRRWKFSPIRLLHEPSFYRYMCVYVKRKYPEYLKTMLIVYTIIDIKKIGQRLLLERSLSNKNERSDKSLREETSNKYCEYGRKSPITDSRVRQWMEPSENLGKRPKSNSNFRERSKLSKIEWRKRE